MVFRAKGALTPHSLQLKPPPPANRRKRGGHAKFVDEALNRKMDPAVPVPVPDASSESELSTLIADTPSASDVSTPERAITPPPPQLSDDQVLEKIASMEPLENPTAVIQSDNLYCPECYLPLHPDPKPERLYIFLHALKYTTSLGSFQTDMPEWAAEDWTWDQT